MMNFDFLFTNLFDKNIAFYIDEKEYTYLEFKQTVFSISNRINEHNIEGQNVGVYLSDDLYSYAAFIAIWLTKNAYVPIHPSYPDNRRIDIINQAEINYVLVTDSHPICVVGPTSINISSLHPAEKLSFHYIEHIKSDLMYILFTSGSTGAPKGVQINCGNLCSFMDHLTSVKMPLTVGDRFLQMFELTFDLSVVSFLFPLQLGGTVYHVGTNQVKYLEIYRLLEEYAINYAIIVPSVLAMLRPYFEDIDLPNLKVVALSGEAVPLKLTEEFQLCCPNASFFNYYGPTECTIFCTAYAIPRTEIKSANGIVSIGKPTLNSVYKLCELPKDGEELNASSELHIGGEQVSIGYVQNEEMNKTLFYKNGETPYYNTGDLVFCDDMGFLYYLGRKDQQVKIQGYRIELMEVEHLCNKALETASVVVAIKNEKGFDELILFVKETEINTITERLNQYLPKYMVPSRIIQMKDFPMNENGKLDRKSLRNSLLNS